MKGDCHIGECNINHSVEDVRKKLTNQKEFIPENVFQGVNKLLQMNLSQETLNEVFHLLKKYDLSSEEQQQIRNIKLLELVEEIK